MWNRLQSGPFGQWLPSNGHREQILLLAFAGFDLWYFGMDQVWLNTSWTPASTGRGQMLAASPFGVWCLWALADQLHVPYSLPHTWDWHANFSPYGDKMFDDVQGHYTVLRRRYIFHTHVNMSSEIEAGWTTGHSTYQGMKMIRYNHQKNQSL